MGSATENVAAALIAAGAAGTIRRMDGSARTAAMAAEQLGVAVGAIASSLIFRIGAEPLLVMTSGAHRVDTTLLARRLGVPKISRADADFVREHTGQTIGGVAPVGHPRPIRTVVDTALADYPQVWAAGGHPHAVFPTTFDELVAMTSGVPMAVADAAAETPAAGE